MQTSSQLIHHNQAIIPDPVLEALKLREGDAIVFEIDQAGVHLRKAPLIDKAFTEALQGTLSEWDSAADDEAYADL
ncbi:MAG: AbrB/MazE/SpoVT family DNA-binding domain-containing protein [Methylococcaceae bacterium]|jgi:bifunctional DNA-binding transcriptional regulator/antitoxin component of YhaV-PrlF toxin-antitoxin module